METLNNFLAIVGTISISIGILRFIWIFLSSGVEWLNNVVIKVETWDEDKDYEDFFVRQGDCIYPEIYQDTPENGEEINVTFFIPENSLIKNLKIKKVVEESIPTGRKIYETVYKCAQITPDHPLCMIVERREAIPKYVVEWHTTYGGKAKYYLYSNLRDGSYNKPGIQYTYSVWSRIRKFFNLV